MPQQAASISLVTYEAGTATFHVHDEDKKDTQEYYKWVVARGYDAAGVPQTVQHHPVRWTSEDGNPSDDADVSFAPLFNGVPPNAVVRYEAFVVIYPNLLEPVSNLLEFAA
jgi:hypothetical protein